MKKLSKLMELIRQYAGMDAPNPQAYLLVIKRLGIMSMIKGVAVSWLACNAAFAGTESVPEYKLLNPQQSTSTKKIEVLEFFSYGCSHCFHLHPQLSAWEKTMPVDVELNYVPAIFNNSAETLASTYYALESMGKARELHDALYRAIHVENMELYDLKTIAGFVEKRGIDREKFSSAYNSFSMQNKLVRAKQMLISHKITGTPTLIVDGKYIITGLQPEETIRALKKVIEMARKEHPVAESTNRGKTKARH